MGISSNPGNVKRLAALLLVIAMGSALAGAKLASLRAGDAGTGTSTSQGWICPMHPQVHAEESGRCPICRMDLVRKTRSSDATVVAKPMPTHAMDSDAHHAVVQNLAVRLTTAIQRELAHEVITYGTAKLATDAVRVLSPKVEGWIRTLHASTPGQRVETNQPLYDFYSPELIQKQREYIDILQRRDKLMANVRDVTGQNAQVLAAMARERVNLRKLLKAADLDDETLTYIEQIRRPLEVVTVRAPGPSVVTEISSASGSFVTPMTPILSMVSTVKLWVDVLLYPDQLGWTSGGEPATVRAGEEVVRGNLELPSLLVDPVSNVVHGRIAIPFTGGIRPGAAVTVTLSCRGRRALSVPSSAVIRRAGRDYVMRWEGDGRFRPVEVGVGIRSREFTEITHGLKVGDQAAAAGEFLIEAESSLSQAPAEPL